MYSQDDLYKNYHLKNVCSYILHAPLSKQSCNDGKVFPVDNEGKMETEKRVRKRDFFFFFQKSLHFVVSLKTERDYKLL